MIRSLIRLTCEAIIFTVLAVGFCFGASFLLPPCGVTLSGGAQLSRTEVVSFQISVGKRLVVPSPLSRTSKEQLNDG